MRKHLLFLLCNLCVAVSINGANIVGGSLRYEALGGSKYKVIGTIIRNCGGDPLNIPTIKVFEKCKGKTVPLSVNRTSIKDLTNICKSNTSPCIPQDTKGLEGQEEHTFESIIDFNVYPYTLFKTNYQCRVFFSMETCCRSYEITNTTTDSFYIESMLWLYYLERPGNSNKINTSPDFFLPEYISSCTGFPFQYNNYVEDIDKDSLVFRIIPPRKDFENFESFIAPYDLHHPIAFNSQQNSFTFDSITGNMYFTPIDTTNGAIITLEIEEYRMLGSFMSLIGLSTKEIYVKIKNCNGNNPPQIPVKDKYAVCEGDKICFNIQTRDTKTINQTKEDTTFMAWNNGIPAGVFKIIDPTAREKQAEFCWQTKKGDVRNAPYRLIVTTKDNSCNTSPAEINKGFEIIVKPKALTKRLYANSSTGLLLFTANPANIRDSLSYEWQIMNSNNTLIFNSYKQSDSFTFSNPGVYYIKCNANNHPLNCPSSTIDTISMNFIPTNLNLFDAYTKIHLYPNPSSGIVNIDLKGSETGKINISNSMGQVLYNSAFTDTNHLTIQLPESVSGPLIVTLQLSNTTVTKKLVIVR